MALSTEERRGSAINVTLLWARPFAPPDGSVQARDRSRLLGIYVGPYTPASIVYPTATATLEANYAQAAVFEAQYADTKTLEVA